MEDFKNYYISDYDVRELRCVTSCIKLTVKSS